MNIVKQQGPGMIVIFFSIDLKRNTFLAIDLETANCVMFYCGCRASVYQARHRKSCRPLTDTVPRTRVLLKYDIRVPEYNTPAIISERIAKAESNLSLSRFDRKRHKWQSTTSSTNTT